MTKITQFKSGRGAKAAYQDSLLETAVQFRSPDPILASVPKSRGLGGFLIVPGFALAANFPSLVAERCFAARGLVTKRKETRLAGLTSQLCIPALLLRVSRRLRSVRPSSRWSSERVGLRNSCVLQADRVAIGLCLVAGCVSCGAHPVFAVVQDVHFGRVVVEPGFWSWFWPMLAWAFASLPFLYGIHRLMKYHVTHD